MAAFVVDALPAAASSTVIAASSVRASAFCLRGVNQGALLGGVGRGPAASSVSR